LGFLSLVFFLGIASNARAQYPFVESFQNATTPPAENMTYGGNASLTSGGADPAGAGYLRLTSTGGSLSGFAWCNNNFPSSQGLNIQFDYFQYGGSGADGISFFLFDAIVPFTIGQFGGSLGYANENGQPGLSSGYLGIGLDKYGNFSNPTQNRNGGPGLRPGAVTVRGAGNGMAATDYPWLATQQTSTLPIPFPLNGATRNDNVSSPDYRRAIIDLDPILGGGFIVTVKIKVGGATPTVYKVLTTTINTIPPTNLKFGFGASTGGSDDFHDIRNVQITKKPSAINQTGTVCGNNTLTANTGIVNAATGALSNNSGGTIDATSVDLDPNQIYGNSKNITVAGEGTYTVNASGIVTFTPAVGFTGPTTTAVPYTINDNFGATSNQATITFTIKTTPLVYTLSYTGTLCKVPGATFSLSKSDIGIAYQLMLNGGATGAAISGKGSAISYPNSTAAGTYTVLATNTSSGCTSPMNGSFLISPLPSTSVAGPNQTVCNVTSASLAGNSPAVGTGTWTVISGPAGSVFTNASLNTTAVTGLTAGTYVFQWSIVSGSCPSSSSTVSITVDNLVLTQTQSNVACFGTSTGTITATGTKGVGAYQYTLNGGTPQSSGFFINLAAGTYIISLTDAGGCSKTSTVVISEPATGVALSSAAPVNVACKGGSTGSVTLTASGGTGPTYTYHLGTFTNTTGVFTGLVAGSYAASVTDVNGCAVTLSSPVVISEPATALSSTITTQQKVKCKGSPTGLVTLTATGGTGPTYTYTLNAVTNSTATATNQTGTFTNLLAGDYNISISDGNACTAYQSVTIAEPASKVSATIAGTNVTCAGDANGKAVATASGGTGPYTYSWTTSPQTTASINGLIAGNYTVTVTDASGCLRTQTVTIGTNAPPIAISESISVMEDKPVNFKLKLNAGTAAIDLTSVDLDLSTPGVQSSLTVPGKGSFTSDNTGGIAFTPVVGYSGSVAITYTVADINGCLSNAATVFIMVKAQPPIAMNDIASTFPASLIQIPVLANETDPQRFGLDALDSDPAFLWIRDGPAVGQDSVYVDPGVLGYRYLHLSGDE